MTKRTARRQRAYQRQPSPVAQDAAPKPMKISPEFVAYAHAGHKGGQGVTAERVFAPYKPAKGVLPSNAMALDSCDFPGLPWAASSYGSGSLYHEGLIFPGYPELALLAQRPEYRLISETIALEATRKWIVFKNNGGADKGAKVDQLKREFDRLDVRAKFREISEQDGFFGRSHLYLDFGDDQGDAQEMRSPIGDGKNDLSKEKVHNKRLDALRVIEPVWTYPATYDTVNPLSGTWYKPQSWYVMGREIHSSRLLVFVSREVPDILKPAYAFGGLSMSQIARPYVENWLQTRQGVNDIIQSFSQFVLKTQMHTILSGDNTGVSNFYARLDAFNLNRNNRGIMAIDLENEDFANVAAPLGGLDHLQAQAQEHMASVAKIPLVKLLGISPSGLNASTEGELQVFDDTIHAYQENFFDHNLRKVFNFTQLTLWGEVDPDLDYEFEHLRELSEKEQAEIASTITAAVTAAHQDQIIDTPTAMQELKKSSDITGLFASITDEAIEEAKLAPPMPGEMGAPGMPPAPGMENGNESAFGVGSAEPNQPDGGGI